MNKTGRALECLAPARSASNPRTVAAKKAWHGDSSSTRRCSGALHTPPVGQQRHRHEFGRRGPSPISSAPSLYMGGHGGPAHSHASHRHRVRRPWHAMPPMVCCWRSSTESRAGQQGSAQCMHLVARWWCGCILASQQAVFFLSFRYCFIFVPFCSCVFFLSLLYTSDISFFFSSPCRVKLDVGSCTYVDGILFQQVC